MDHAPVVSAGSSVAWKTNTIAVVLAIAAGSGLLLVPAVVNGFPFLFYDTGGYLAAASDRVVTPGRSIVYGLLLTLGAPGQFWLTALIQCALSAWMVALTARIEGLPGGMKGLLALYAGLAAFTALPFVAGQLMPDIFAALGPLALYLLLWRRDRLRRIEALALVALAAYSAGAHKSVLAVEFLQVAATIVGAAFLRPLRRRMSLRLPILVLCAGLAFGPLTNLVVAGRFMGTPGGISFVFGRLLEDGMVHRYLNTHCPDPHLELCRYKDDLPDTANDFLWDDHPTFNAIGGFEGGVPVLLPVIVRILEAYPLENLIYAVKASTLQLVTLKTGDNLLPYLGHTIWAVRTHAPAAAPAMMAAWQQTGEGLDFSALNLVHQPAAWLAGLLVLGLGIGAIRRRDLRAVTFAGGILTILMANAVVCGTLSNPTDRYQARVAWLAVMAVPMLAFSAAAASQRRSQGRP